jgi:hypothetical protein
MAKTVYDSAALNHFATAIEGYAKRIRAVAKTVADKDLGDLKLEHERLKARATEALEKWISESEIEADTALVRLKRTGAPKKVANG